MTDTISFNNRLILEPYKGDRALKSKTEGAFALVQQKTSIVGLRLLADAALNFGGKSLETMSKGSVVYIREELLYTQAWAQKVYESEAVEGKFIIVDLS